MSKDAFKEPLLLKIGGPGGSGARPEGERADAAKNREKILSAARNLLQTLPISAICMDAVAHEAGVGKGTVYRRFPDRTALCLALLDENTRALQNRTIAGFDLPETAPISERILALLDALFDFAIDCASLLAEAWAAHKGGADRYDHPGHAWQREALSRMIAAAIRAEEIEPVGDCDLAAEILLAPINPVLLGWLCARSPRDEVKSGYREVWSRILISRAPL